MQNVATTRDISATILISRLQAKPMTSVLSRVEYTSLRVAMTGVADHTPNNVRTVTASAYETSRSFGMPQISKLGEMILEAVETLVLTLLFEFFYSIHEQNEQEDTAQVFEICSSASSSPIEQILFHFTQHKE